MQTKASFRLHHILVTLAIIRNVNKGLRRHLSMEELLLFFQKTNVPFPAPIWGGSHWPVIPFPGDQMSTFGLHGHLHLLHIHSHRYIRVHININKSYTFWTQQHSCKYELTAVVTASTRSGQAWARENSNMGKGGKHKIWPLTIGNRLLLGKGKSLFFNSVSSGKSTVLQRSHTSRACEKHNLDLMGEWKDTTAW